MKTEFNLDIHPKDDTRALYPRLGFIFDNNRLREAFSQRDADAARFKARYWRLTTLAVILISVSVVSAISFWLFTDDVPKLPLRQIAGYTGFLGLSGAGLELFLIVTRTKEKWLFNRFLAERLRSYIAQLYAAGAAARDEAAFRDVVQSYTTHALAALDGDAQMGKAAFRRFQPEHGILTFGTVSDPSPDLLRECQTAYQTLRVDFQKKFVKGELEKLSDLGRVENSVTDISFILGVAFTVVGLLALPFPLDDLVSKSMVLAGVLLFFLSAILGLTGTGNVSQGNYRRYQNYLDQIDALPSPTDESPEAFVERIKHMETEALRELEAFCTQVDSASFRI